MTQDAKQPVYFHCSMCGECCSSWNIPCEGDKARALLARDWVQARLAETRRELVKITDDLYRLPLNDENVCVFLAEDRRCMVEVHEGMALKPHECQRFPFATVKMPDGSARHDTSAACKQISEKLLLAFEPILPRSGASEPDDSEHFPKRVYTGMFRQMDLPAYEAYLRQLQTIFNRPDRPSEAALLEAKKLLKGPSSRQARHYEERSDAAISSEQRLLLRRRLPRACGPRNDTLSGDLRLTLMTVRTPDTLKTRNDTLSDDLRLTGWREKLCVTLFLRKPYRTMSWLSLLQGRQYDDPRVFGFPVDLQAQAGIAWSTGLDHHVNAFLYNLLCRRLLVARGHSLAAMLAMAAAACILVRWYARTLAWVRNAEAVELSDVTAAIRLVERYYTGHQPRFLRFFNARWKGWLFLRLLLS